MLSHGIIGKGRLLAGFRLRADLSRWFARITVGGFSVLFSALMVYGLERPYILLGDSVIYILLAQALIAGEGYRDIWWVGSPPHSAYPPVFPLLLTPIISLYGAHLWALRLWIVGLSVLALYAVYVLFRRVADDKTALAILVLTGTSYGLWFHAQSILSEIPYMLFSVLGLLFVEQYKRAWNPFGGPLWLAALTIGAAALTRTVGLALLVGGVAYLVFEGGNGAGASARKRLIKSVLLAAIGSVPVLLWCLRNWVVSGGAEASFYLQQFGLKDYGSVDSTMTGVRDLVELAYHNLYVYTLAAAAIVLPALPSPPGKIVALLVTAMLGVGLLICCRTRRTAWEYYGLAYICVLLLYPAAYPRYLVPMIPLLWYYALVSLRHGTRFLPLGLRLPMRLRWAAGEPVVWGLVTVLIGLNLVSSVNHTFVNPAHEDAYEVDREESGYLNSLPWVEEHTAADSVFMWSKPGQRYLLVRRKAASLPTTTDRQKVLQAIDDAQVDYVAIDTFSDSSRRYLKPVIDEYPERFSLVYKDRTTWIYQVVQ